MADSPKKKTGDGKTVDAWEAISNFEQILQAFPNDYVALDALVHAYETVGDHTRAREYLLRLANLLIEQADGDSAQLLLEKIKLYADADPEAKAVAERIEALQTTRPAKPAPGPERVSSTRAQEALKRASPVADELSFAWHLLQSGLLTQEEYVSVAHDLTEVSSKEREITISVLHVLHDRGFRNLENVLVFVAGDTHLPVVSIGSFDLQKETALLLPLDFTIRRGAMVFELLGPDALVALMNPYNHMLQQDVAAILNRRCHFFITEPSDFDAAVNRIRALKEEPEAKPK